MSPDDGECLFTSFYDFYENNVSATFGFPVAERQGHLSAYSAFTK